MRVRRRNSFTSFLVLLVVVGSSPCRTARADDGPWLFSLGAAATFPVTHSQSALFEPGASAHAMVALPLGRHAAVEARLFGGLLADGPAPSDGNRIDPGLGTWLGAGLGLTLRPLGDLDPSHRATGLLLTVEGGGAWTGALVRPALSGALGWGFAWDDVVVTPELRVLHVVQLDDPLDTSQAVLVSAGLSLVFGDTTPPLVVEEEPPRGPLDSDGDGILDELDACPDVPEDADGLADEDGCPEDDFDQDEVPDVSDACSSVPEDRDGLEDTDGCPEDDADVDGILDPADACPEAPETQNGLDDQDGCPDEGLIVLEGDRVVLDETVLFDTSRARVHRAARPVLAANAQLFLEHEEWGTMRVEGHADSRGESELNEWLSTLRAERVRDVLVGLGVPAERIEIAGYGETRPRAEGEGEAALARNRRVEFVMLDAPPAGSDEGGAP